MFSAELNLHYTEGAILQPRITPPIRRDPASNLPASLILGITTTLFRVRLASWESEIHRYFGYQVSQLRLRGESMQGGSIGTRLERLLQ